MISIIVAIAENFVIGKNNDLPWHIPADLKRFKKITVGHPVIMGKNTYLSLPKRPLADRVNVVITDDPKDEFEGCKVVRSIRDAIRLTTPEEESFVIGGASVYRQFLPFVDRLYLTLIHKKFEGDVFFPEINFSEWVELSREDLPYDESLGFSYSYVTYER
jgi:dihydrofolate reductase